jgi:hypothetical protein
VLLTPLTSYEVDDVGNVFAAPTHQPGVIAVFDATGRLSRSIGKKGTGPDENGNIIRLIHAGGSLRFLDEGRQRVVVLSASDAVQAAHRLARPVDSSSDLVWLGDRFAYGTPYARDEPGSVVIAAGDRVVASDISPPAADGGAAAQSYFGRQRRLTAAGGSRFWVAHSTVYTLELWTADGRLERVISRSPHWFGPWTPITNLPWRTKWPPLVVGIWYSPDGLLFTATMVPKVNWQPAPAGANVGAANLGDYVDTVKEVIDPVSGSLVLSERLPGERRFVGTRGHLMSFTADADGVITATLYKVHVQR